MFNYEELEHELIVIRSFAKDAANKRARVILEARPGGKILVRVLTREEAKEIWGQKGTVSFEPFKLTTRGYKARVLAAIAYVKGFGEGMS